MVSRDLWNKQRRHAPHVERLIDKAKDDIGHKHEKRVNHDLGGTFFRHPIKDEMAPERAYFRSVASVKLSEDGQYQVLGPDGSVMGTHRERWMAWCQADKFGIERAIEMEMEVADGTLR